MSSSIILVVIKRMGGTGLQINRADWTKERIAAFRRYLGGDTDVTFRGKKKNGEFYKKALKVSRLIDYYKPLQFSFRKGAVHVTGGQFGARQILTDDQVKTRAMALYKHKENGLGKAPSIYNFMKTKYVNVSYKKVDQAVQSLPQYQKWQARHIAKPKVRTVIISKGPGTQIDTDLMHFSTEYYMPSKNEGFSALAVVVDRFSGFIAVAPLLHGKGGKGAETVAHKTANMITGGAFPRRAAGGVIFHDNGSEYKGIFPERMKQIGYKNVVISQAAGAPSPHAERAVGIIRKLINIKLTSGGQNPRKATRNNPTRQKWWPLARTIVRSYNATPLTDSRAPASPNQLKVMGAGARAKIVKGMKEAGAKRIDKQPSRKDAAGNKVSKVLKILKVGDRVRYAVEHVRKSGANKRPYPKKRWSDTVHAVARVITRKLGFANYVLNGRPGRRFEREDLQGPLAG